MGCLRLTYEEDESPLRVSREEENVSVEWQVWVNAKPAKKVKEAVDTQSGGNVQQAGMLDVPLALWSIGSYAYGINENLRAISIAEQNLSMLKKLQKSTRLSLGRPTATDRNLAKLITKNNKMLQGIKLGAKRMVGVGKIGRAHV